MKWSSLDAFKEGEIDKERDVEEFLDRKAAEFEVRSRQVQMVESPVGVC